MYSKNVTRWRYRHTKFVLNVCPYGIRSWRLRGLSVYILNITSLHKWKRISESLIHSSLHPRKTYMQQYLLIKGPRIVMKLLQGLHKMLSCHLQLYKLLPSYMYSQFYNHQAWWLHVTLQYKTEDYSCQSNKRCVNRMIKKLLLLIKCSKSAVENY